MILYDHQKKAIDDVYAEFSNRHNIVVLDAKISTGKTLIACEMAKEYDGKVVISLSISSLIEQFIDTFKAIEFEDYSVIKAGMENQYNSDAKVTLVMEQTLHSRLSEHRNMRCDLLIVEEAHQRVQSKRFIDIASLLKPKNQMLMTGTPYTPWGEALPGKTVTVKSIKELTKERYLTKVKYLVPKFSLEKKVNQKFGSEMTNEELAEFNAIEFKNNTVDAFMSNDYFDYREVKSLWFCSNIEQAEEYCSILQQKGLHAMTYHGKLKNSLKNDILSSYRNNTEITVTKDINLFNYKDPIDRIIVKHLVSVRSLTTGFSVSDIDVGVETAPIMSLSLKEQIDGRLARTSENKNIAYILDCGKNCLRLGMLEDEYIPPAPGSERKELKDAIAKLALEHFDIYAREVDSDIVEVDRDAYEKKIQSIKDDNRRLSELSLDELIDRLIVVDDWEEVFYTGIALCERALSEPMKDKWGNWSTGYLAESFNVQAQSIEYKPVVGFYNSNSIEWMMELYYPLFDLKDTDNASTIKSIKTRLRSIIRTKKSIYSIRFFAEFLMAKYLDDNFVAKHFIKRQGCPMIVERLEEGDHVVESKDYAKMYLDKQDDEMLTVTAMNDIYENEKEIDIMNMESLDGLSDDEIPFGLLLPLPLIGLQQALEWCVNIHL